MELVIEGRVHVPSDLLMELLRPFAAEEKLPIADGRPAHSELLELHGNAFLVVVTER